MSTNEFCLRIPPDSPRQQHVIKGRVWRKSDGWITIKPAQAAELARVKLFAESPTSPPLFQIVSGDEARAISRAEAKAKRGAGPVDPVTGKTLEERNEELESQVGKQQQQLSRMAALLLKTGLVEPADLDSIGIPRPKEDDEEVAPDSEPPKKSARAEKQATPPPPKRPGARAKAETKPEADGGDAKPSESPDPS